MKKQLKTFICTLFVLLLIVFSAYAQETAAVPADSEPVLPEETSETEIPPEAPGDNENEEEEEEPSVPVLLLGDTDRDGTIEASDARTLLRAFVKLEKADLAIFYIYDADLSGRFDAADARMTMRRAVNLEEPEAHAFEATEVLAPSCTENGLMNCSCADCGTALSLIIPANGHTDEEISRTASTCTKDGFVEYRCSVCGTESRRDIHSTGHDYVTIVITPATCTKSGKTQTTCTRCDYKKDTAVPAKEHNMLAATAISPKKCSECGLIVSGWTDVKGKSYYFRDDGTRAENCIIDNTYIDNTGAAVNDSVIKTAVLFVNKHSDPSDTPYERFSDCYQYICKNYPYLSSHGIPAASDIPDCAASFFSLKKGNCYKYASAVAYIAKILGFEVKVETGQVFGHNGIYSPHGWTWVQYNDQWHMCDAMMEARWHDNCFMCSITHYPYRFKNGKTYSASCRDGIISWT